MTMSTMFPSMNCSVLLQAFASAKIEDGHAKKECRQHEKNDIAHWFLPINPKEYILRK